MLHFQVAMRPTRASARVVGGGFNGSISASIRV